MSPLWPLMVPHQQHDSPSCASWSHAIQWGTPLHPLGRLTPIHDMGQTDYYPSMTSMMVSIACSSMLPTAQSWPSHCLTTHSDHSTHCHWPPHLPGKEEVFLCFLLDFPLLPWIFGISLLVPESMVCADNQGDQLGVSKMATMRFFVALSVFLCCLPQAK